MESAVSHGSGKRGRWGRVAGALVLVVLLGYGLAHLWIRSPWFHGMVERRLSAMAGMEVHTGRIRATESLNLKIRDVIGVTEVAGFEAKVARVRWRLFRREGEPVLESIRLEDLSVTVAPDAEGQWQPAFLTAALKRSMTMPGPLELLTANLSESGDANEDNAANGAPEMVPAVAPDAEVRHPGSGAPDVPMLRVTRGSFRLRDAAGTETASALGVYLERTQHPGGDGRRLDYVRVEIETLSVRGLMLTGVEAEWVVVGGKPCLLSLNAADWGGWAQPPPPGAEARELLNSF